MPAGCGAVVHIPSRGIILTAPNHDEEDAMQDPVCGMDVTQDTAAAAWEYEGTTYLFCSTGCMERFREDPQRYLGMDPSERSM